MATNPDPMCLKKGLSWSKKAALKISLEDQNFFFTDSSYAMNQDYENDIFTC